MNAIFKVLHELFGNQKAKMLGVLLFTLLFALVLIPNDDLSDWVSMQITRKTGVYFQFDGLSLDFFPSPGISAENIIIEQRGMPALKAGSMQVGISIFKALTAKIGASANVRKIFGGNIDVDYQQDGKAKSGAPFDEITAHAERISLEELGEFLRSANLLAFKMQGIAKLDIKRLRVDQGFAEQPSGLINLEVPSFAIPGQTVIVNFNDVPVPQSLPTLEFGRLNLKNLKFNEGAVDIPELTIGTPQSELYGRVKGGMSFNMRKLGPNVQPEISGVKLHMKLVADKAFMERNQKSVIGGMFMLMQGCKNETAKGTEFNCEMRLNRPGDMASFVPSAEKF